MAEEETTEPVKTGIVEAVGTAQSVQAQGVPGLGKQIQEATHRALDEAFKKGEGVEGGLAVSDVEGILALKNRIREETIQRHNAPPTEEAKG